MNITQLQHSIHELEVERNRINFKIKKLQREMERAQMEDNAHYKEKFGFKSDRDFRLYSQLVDRHIIDWNGNFRRPKGLNTTPHFRTAMYVDQGHEVSVEDTYHSNYTYGLTVDNFIKGCYLLMARHNYQGGYDGEPPISDKEAYTRGISMVDRATIFADDNPEYAYYKSRFGELTHREMDFIEEPDDQKAKLILRELAESDE